MKKRKLLLLTLIVISLVGSLFTYYQVKVFKSPTLAIVPIDNRPISLYAPKKLSEISGINVIFPEEKYLGDFKKAGKTDKVNEWLLENGEKVDGFIISTDMIAYGGLVASRTNKTSKENALSNIAIIKKLKEKYPNKPIYVYNAVQRLTITLENEKVLKDYWNIKNWAIAYDEFHNLGIKEKADDIKRYESLLPPSLIENYLDTRKRNHEINLKMVEWLNKGYIDYLILSQDDASKTGLHRYETEIIKNKAEEYNLDKDKIMFFSGTDEDSLVLISRYVNQLYHVKPTYFIDYIDNKGSEWIDSFDSLPVEENIKNHISAIGGTTSKNKEKADLHLFVNTPLEKEEKEEKFNSQIAQINTSLSTKPTIIVDLDRKVEELRLMDTLREKSDIYKLYSFSSWNTSGNAIGISLAHSSVRYAFLYNNLDLFIKKDISINAAKSHTEFLIHRLAKDEGYKNGVQNDIKKFVEENKGDYWDLGKHYQDTYNYSKDKVIKETYSWFEHFKQKSIVYKIEKNNQTKDIKISSLEKVYFDFPWKRLFDADLEPTIKIEE